MSIFHKAQELKKLKVPEKMFAEEGLRKIQKFTMEEFVDEFFENNGDSFNQYEILYNVYLCLILLEKYEEANEQIKRLGEIIPKSFSHNVGILMKLTQAMVDGNLSEVVTDIPGPEFFLQDEK